MRTLAVVVVLALGGCAIEQATERGSMSVYDHEMKHAVEGRDHPEIHHYDNHWWTTINLAPPCTTIKWVQIETPEAQKLLLGSRTEARVIRHTGEPVCTVLSKYSEAQAKQIKD